MLERTSLLSWHARSLFLLIALFPACTASAQLRDVQQRTAKGILEGAISADGQVRMFRGIPYAAAPVGRLRWRAPQPVAPWRGVRKAHDFAPRCMQTGDWNFRDPGPSEDCLYLNVWMPAEPKQPRLPVMVWIHGGGFVSGAASEPRQDGSNLSRKGVIVVSMNYRLGIFGFFSHPDLDRESGHNASGNYGLLDQVAALQWVKSNVAKFGGDPDNVTIFGESAGSISVSGLMASPLARGLFRRAIGESGSFFRRHHSHSEMEKTCVEFAKSVLKADSVDKLRAISAAELLQATSTQGTPGFGPATDGYFLPETVDAIFAAGKQNHVALLAGWNADESGYRDVFGNDEPTPEALAVHVRDLYGANADTILKLYSAQNSAEAKRAAADLASDRFIAFSTWKWMELHRETGGSAVYRYRFDQTLPLPAGAQPHGAEPAAPHAADIEFVFRTLSAKDLPWRPADYELSELMAAYWTNFAKTGDPNGEGLPHWPLYKQDENQVMHLSAHPAVAPDDQRERYRFLDRIR
ncbi:MAG TPA: carboxylesterase/lipase family protein [Steroidobacteraceae bacterium]